MRNRALLFVVAAVIGLASVLRHGYETSGCGGHAAWSKGGCWSALIWAGVR